MAHGQPGCRKVIRFFIGYFADPHGREPESPNEAHGALCSGFIALSRSKRLGNIFYLT
jgi:hypothetical protein